MTLPRDYSPYSSLSNDQLRASPIAVTIVASILPSGISTQLLQTAGNASLASIDAKLTGPVSVLGPATNAELRAVPLPISVASLPLPSGASTEATLAGVLTTSAFQARTPAAPTTGATTSVTVTTAAVTALASNAARRGAMVFNDGDGYVYLCYGAGASATVFAARLSPNDYYEVAFGYTGLLTAFRSTGSAPIRVTEIT